MESLQDKAYNAIYTKIMNLDLYPGQQVSDKQFEEEIGVSRTPVREAMLRLRRDDMLYSLPQSGTYVTRIDLKNHWMPAMPANCWNQTSPSQSVALCPMTKSISCQLWSKNSKRPPNVIRSNDSFKWTTIFIKRFMSLPTNKIFGIG